jgi:hypothetical protein
LYEGHRIRFRPEKYGEVRATCVNEDGMVVDTLRGVDFADAWQQASAEWPGAEWINREEE